MIENIQRLGDEARSKIQLASDAQELERIRVQYLGKKGLLTELLHQLKSLDPDRRKEVGAVVNRVKADFESHFGQRLQELDRVAIEKELANAKPLDLTLPGYVPVPQGSLHPVTRVLDDMVAALRRIGYSIATGPEVELEEYNFDALNQPADHPARDLHDTFYLGRPRLLRSHTSPMQVRAMRSMKPPLALMSFGKVYRSDYDQTHTPMFHQLEGLMVDEHVSFSDLKGILQYLVRELFGARPLRFRSSYFPFTEPSAEVDMQCFQCRGAGCRLCKETGWLEIAGSGMVHPNVFRACGYDPESLSGFAFGFGIERVALLRYGMDDLRSLFENDTRLLEQF
jgi:phenylalanyl-tRNA synthetase alpha chain